MSRLVGLVVMVGLVVGVIMYPTAIATEPKVEEPANFPSHQLCPEKQWINEEQPEGEVMSIDKEQLRQLIREVLLEVDLHSAKAEELLMLTSATESHLGKFLTQEDGDDDPNDGGVGIFQMEKATEEDIWDNYLAYRSELSNKVIDVIGGGGLSKFELRANLTYQIVMARIHYLRVKAPLPAADDVGRMAAYYKVHYNTHKGKATILKAIESYHYYVKEA